MTHTIITIVIICQTVVNIATGYLILKLSPLEIPGPIALRHKITPALPIYGVFYHFFYKKAIITPFIFVENTQKTQINREKNKRPSIIDGLLSNFADNRS